MKEVVNKQKKKADKNENNNSNNNNNPKGINDISSSSLSLAIHRV